MDGSTMIPGGGGGRAGGVMNLTFGREEEVEEDWADSEEASTVEREWTEAAAWESVLERAWE